MVQRHSTRDRYRWHCTDRSHLYASDSQAAIGMAEKAQFSKKTKHIAIRYHYIRDLVKSGVIEMVFVPTAEMIADGLTKAVGTEKFKWFVQALNIAN